MTRDNWKTLRVPPEKYEEAKAQKDEHGRTWGEQLVCDNPTTTEVVALDEIDAQLSHDSNNVDAIAERVVEELSHDGINVDALADEVSNNIDTTPDVDVSTDKLAEAIADRVDTLTGTDPEVLAREVSRQVSNDMAAELPRKIAEELQ